MNDNLRELFNARKRYASYYKIIYKDYNYVKDDLLGLLNKMHSYNISRVYKREF